MICQSSPTIYYEGVAGLLPGRIRDLWEFLNDECLGFLAHLGTLLTREPRRFCTNCPVVGLGFTVH